MKMTRLSAGLAVIAMWLSVAGPAGAQTAAQLLEARCSSCHNLTGPAPTSLAAVWQRKGPDLFYAGNKYKQAWLVEWLQAPQRIRPAGMYYGNHIRAGEEGDEIDEQSLTPHLSLDETQARAVAAYLMTLTGKAELVKQGDYQPGTISRSMGEMMFDKFRGCLACHQIEPGYGGLSGPEVYTAARRLQEDYLISFMRNPVAWQPRTLMPAKKLKERDLQKFVHYFRLLSEVQQ